ncbi:hypothetical protein ACLOJK_023878 [Asimina triloba]
MKLSAPFAREFSSSSFFSFSFLKKNPHRRRRFQATLAQKSETKQGEEEEEEEEEEGCRILNSESSSKSKLAYISFLSMGTAVASSCSFPIPLPHHPYPSKRQRQRQRQNPIFLAKSNSPLVNAPASSAHLSLSTTHRPLRPPPRFPFPSSSRRPPHSLRPRRGRKPISAVFERYTERAIKALVFSQREALALGKHAVYPHHLLLGLIAEDTSPDGYLGSGITFQQVHEIVAGIRKDDEDDYDGTSTPDAATNSSGRDPRSASDIPFSVSSKRVFDTAAAYSRNMGYNFIAPEHILIAIFAVSYRSRVVIERYSYLLLLPMLLDESVNQSIYHAQSTLGGNVEILVSAAVLRLQGELAKEGREPSTTHEHGHGTCITCKAADVKPIKDLTARARKGCIDPVIGRDIEVQRIVQILCRRTKNNPILLGEPGVGKTAIAEGLAIAIEKRIMSLDVGLLMAGTRERGELEGRVTSLISEVKKAGDVILFIDEVHTLIGTGPVGRGNKGSGLDLANLMKQPLGRGELQCIASTTMDEYRTHFEKDKALDRRFQPVLINEPNQEDAVRILLGLREKYEAHHKCRFTLAAINAAVYLSARYIADRYLPDKAIDLIDEAGSKARMDALKKRKEQQTSILSRSPNDYWQEIRAVQAMRAVVQANKMKNSLDGNGGNDGDTGVEDDANLSSGPSFAFGLDDGYYGYAAALLILPVMVGPEEVAAVASSWSGIPVKQLNADERTLLVGLDEELRKRVVGQDEAVNAIARAVKRSSTGLKDPDRPIAAMLFCGPTGVGKTELTKALAASYFGSETAMLRLDMSEYMEQHTVSKLIGSPPGYVGYGQGGTLTEAVRRKPFTVILLDEIEKAHPAIFNILLQVFEDGHLTDSQGRRVSFKNVLLVMTSNVGSTAIVKGGHNSIGFLLRDESESSSYNGLKALIMEELKAYFRPELLNRIDEVVVFRPLEKTQMLEILKIMLKEVKARIMSLGMGLEVSHALMDLVCQKGYDRSYGARPLRRAVTHYIEDVVSEAMLSGEYKPGDTAVVDVDASGNPFVSLKSDQSIHLSDTASAL